MVPNLLLPYQFSLCLFFFFLMKIDNVSNSRNKKLVSIYVTINLNFILAICYASNFYLKYNDRN